MVEVWSKHGWSAPIGYYYGLLLLYRNGLVALLPVVLLELPQLQLPLMGGALLASVIVQSRLLPWRTPWANNVELMPRAMKKSSRL